LFCSKKRNPALEKARQKNGNKRFSSGSSKKHRARIAGIGNAQALGYAEQLSSQRIDRLDALPAHGLEQSYFDSSRTFELQSNGASISMNWNRTRKPALCVRTHQLRFCDKSIGQMTDIQDPMVIPSLMVQTDTESPLGTPRQ
jgi:hypothetical protein